MIEPVLALQTAIRTRLIGKQAVTDLVSPENIGALGKRPGDVPCIVMSDGSTTLHGYDYTSQRAARVFVDLHVWVMGDFAQDRSKEIAGAAMSVLDKRDLTIEGGYCDDFRVTACRFPRDPDARYGHGVLSVEAVIRWFV